MILLCQETIKLVGLRVKKSILLIKITHIAVQKLIFKITSMNGQVQLFLLDQLYNSDHSKMGCVSSEQASKNQLRSKGKPTERAIATTLYRTSTFKNNHQSSKACQLLIENIARRTKKTIKSIQLAFKASQHKFKASSFHELCNGRSNTVLIALTENNCFFGGFTPCTWKKDEFIAYEQDVNCQSFLFRVSNNELTIYDIKSQASKFAIMNDEELGPVFGEGHDILISDQSDKKQSWNNLGKSYNCEFKFGSQKANKTLCEQQRYKLKQYQIWAVTFA